MWMILSESSLFRPSKIYISSLYTKLMHSYIFRWCHVWSQLLKFLLLIFFPFISLAEAVLLGDTFLNPIRSAALLDENRASTLRFSWREKERKKDRCSWFIEQSKERRAWRGFEPSTSSSSTIQRIDALDRSTTVGRPYSFLCNRPLMVILL